MSPDFIFNEELFQMIFEKDLCKKLKMNEDYILIHKNLFEYLYGIYGCDYFILAKTYEPASTEH
jgi:uncharacterized protein YutD